MLENNPNIDQQRVGKVRIGFQRRIGVTDGVIQAAGTEAQAGKVQPGRDEPRVDFQRLIQSVFTLPWLTQLLVGRCL